MSRDEAKHAAESTAPASTQLAAKVQKEGSRSDEDEDVEMEDAMTPSPQTKCTSFLAPPILARVYVV